MPAKQPKKMTNIVLLEILRKHSDANHRLSQKEIAEILEREHDMVIDRKTMRRTLMELVDYGFDISYSQTKRIGKNGETDTVTGDWYIQHDFEEVELRLLIDSLLFTNHVPAKQKKTLIRKLQHLASRNFKSRVKHVAALPEQKQVNMQLFYTMETIDEAIAAKMKVRLSYGSYATDGKLHPRLNDDGSIKRYTASPYQMVAVNGRYYLICYRYPFEQLTHLRVDRILDIEIINDKVQSLNGLPGYEHGIDLPKHMAEQLYMFASKPEHIKMRVSKTLLNVIFDWFGDNIIFSNETDEYVDVLLTANPEAMRYWAMQYSEIIEILEPASLREQLLGAGKRVVEKYRS